MIKAIIKSDKISLKRTGICTFSEAITRSSYFLLPFLHMQQTTKQCTALIEQRGGNILAIIKKIAISAKT